MTDTDKNALETLVSRAVEPGIDDLSRANRARVALDSAEDTAALMGLVPKLFPGIAIAAARVNRSKRQNEPIPNKAQRVLDAHAGLSEFTAARSAITEIIGSNEPTPALEASYTATPLILEAVSLELSGSLSHVAPSLVVDAEGQVDAEDYSLGTEFAVEDAGGRLHLAAVSVPCSMQVLDWVDDNGAAFIDQVIHQMINRAAERHIGQALITAAGTALTAGSDLASALDTAEAQAAEAVLAECDQIIVNPADWPRVRRVIAQSWENGPHPRPMVSIGMPKGTIIMTGYGAVYTEASEPVNSVQKMLGHGLSDPDQTVVLPDGFGQWLTLGRYFRTNIREAAGIVAISL